MKRNKGGKSSKFERCPRCGKFVDKDWMIMFRGRNIGCGNNPCRRLAISKVKGGGANSKTFTKSSI